MECPDHKELQEWVGCYNRIYSSLDNKVWRIGQDAKKELLESLPDGVLSDSVKSFARQVARWGNIRGIKDDDFPKAAQGLWKLDDLREKIHDFDNKKLKPEDSKDREVVCSLVKALVVSMRECGVNSNQWSWASKMLHWLLPTFFPIYDSKVREALCTEGVAKSGGESAYKEIIDQEYNWAKNLLIQSGSDADYIEPHTVLRAIDRYIWLKSKQDPKPSE
jgi:hypothetical protein